MVHSSEERINAHAQWVLSSFFLFFIARTNLGVVGLLRPEFDGEGNEGRVAAEHVAQPERIGVPSEWRIAGDGGAVNGDGTMATDMS